MWMADSLMDGCVVGMWMVDSRLMDVCVMRMWMVDSLMDGCVVGMWMTDSLTDGRVMGMDEARDTPAAGTRAPCTDSSRCTSCAGTGLAAPRWPPCWRRVRRRLCG